MDDVVPTNGRHPPGQAIANQRSAPAGAGRCRSTNRHRPV